MADSADSCLHIVFALRFCPGRACAYNYIVGMSTIEVTHFNDSACPWGYSASPALAVLRWRYAEQLDWRLVMIGLAENADRYLDHGFTPTRFAQGYASFRDRYGMPFVTTPRSRVTATARVCRAVVATRLLDPAREYEAFRALQFSWFASTLVLDQAEDIAEALGRVSGLDVAAVVGALDDPRVTAAYEADKARARSAAGGPTEFQGKAAVSDGLVRYTAPSLIFELDGKRLEGGGFQTIEAYDVLLANLDPTLERNAPPESPLEVLERFPAGLVTQEVAAIMAPNNVAVDRGAAELALIELAGAGSVRREPLGDDALWLLA
jgi:2-hydroxychromene-2-carboxylate isomerase